MSETYLGEIELTDDTLAHYGILGMKWGVRRYQNGDGSYTEAGKKRYSKKEKTTRGKKKLSTGQKVAIAGGVMVGAALAVYGGYKLRQFCNISKEVSKVLNKDLDKKALKLTNIDVKHRKDILLLDSDVKWRADRFNKYRDMFRDETLQKIKGLTMEEFKYQTKYNYLSILDKIKPDMFGPRTAYMEYSPLDIYKKSAVMTRSLKWKI